MTIIIKNKVDKKIKEYCSQMGNDEIGGLLTGEIKENGDLVIKGVVLLEQEAGVGEFEINEEALMNLTKNANGKFLSSIIGWWHSHGNFATFWSSVDDDCFKRLCNLCSRCFGLVVSNRKNGEMRCRYDTYDKEGIYISIDDINPEFDGGFFKLNINKMKRNINKKVKVKEVIPIFAPKLKKIPLEKIPLVFDGKQEIGPIEVVNGSQ